MRVSAAGTRFRRPSTVNSVAGTSDLLFTSDIHTGRRFLIDTGADIRVYPPTPQQRHNSPGGLQLLAANGSNIRTYGEQTVQLNIGQRQYSWKFVVADVASPIPGADFLRTHALLVEMANRRLVDVQHLLVTPLTDSNCPSPFI